MAPSFAEVHLPAEPPTKRRRTNEHTSPKRRSDEEVIKEVPGLVEAAQQSESARITVQDHNQHAPAIHGDTSATTTGVIPTKQAPRTTKKAPRIRRKLCLNDETEQREAPQISWEPRNAGLEDTFIFGLKRQRKTGDGAITDDLKQKAKKRTPKAKKTTEAKRLLEDKLEPEHDTQPVAESKRPEKKLKTTRKKNLASKATTTIAATEVNSAIESPINSRADHGPEDSGQYFTAAEDLPEENVKTTPKPVKTKPAPKRGLKRTNDETATAAESMPTATPEKPTKRPRRQAAISAIEKVAMGYEADLIPVDKLRRAPEAGSKPRKSRKADGIAFSAAPLSTPLSTTQTDMVVQDSQDCDKNESLPSPPVIVKQGRKPSVKSTKGRACKSDEQPEVVEPLPAKLLSPVKEESHMLEDEPSRSPKLPTKRGRKPGVTAARKRACELDVEMEVLERLSTKHVFPVEDKIHAPVDELLPSPKPTAKRGRKPGVSVAEGRVGTLNKETEVLESPSLKHVSSAKDDPHAPGDELPKPPARRGRKPGVKAAKGHSGAAGDKQGVLQLQPAELLLPTEEDNHACDEERPPSSKLPAKRGRKPGVKNRKIDVATTHVDPTVESVVTESAAMGPEHSVDTGSKAQAPKVHRNEKTGGKKRLREAIEYAASTKPLQEAGGHPRQLADQPSATSDKTDMIQRSTKQRRALADFDGNIVKRSLQLEGKKLVPSAVDCASPSAKQKSKPRKTKNETAEQSDINTIRSDRAQQHLLQFQCLQDEGPSHETTTTPRKRHVIAADEDLDWLFETSESRRPKPATVRHPNTKTRRKAAAQTANDMDLDDMLAAVAGFSGTLLTGRRGRDVAS